MAHSLVATCCVLDRCLACQQVSREITKQAVFICNPHLSLSLFPGLLPMQAIGLPGLPAGAMPMPGMSVMLPGHPNMLQMLQPRFRWCLPDAAPGLLQAPPPQDAFAEQVQQPFAAMPHLETQASLVGLPLPLLFHDWHSSSRSSSNYNNRNSPAEGQQQLSELHQRSNMPHVASKKQSQTASKFSYSSYAIPKLFFNV